MSTSQNPGARGLWKVWDLGPARWLVRHCLWGIARSGKLTIDSCSHFPDRSHEISRNLTDLREILLVGPSRFGQATLNESVPSLGHRRHESSTPLVATSHLCNRVNHEAVVSKTISMTGRSPCVYNALGNAASQSQRCCCQHPHSPAADLRCSTAVNDTTARIRTLRYRPILMVISMVERTVVLSANIAYWRAATCAFFTSLARWKFSQYNCP